MSRDQAVADRTVHQTVSTDGTRIDYEKVGTGPALVLVDGAMCTRDFGPSRDVAAALQDRYTVYFYDRRGRGTSGDTAPYAPEREFEDLAAVVAATGEVPFVMGQSSGAGLALRAAASGVPMRALASYEAPFVGLRPGKDGKPKDYLGDLEALIASGKRGEAVGYFLVQMIGAPPFVPIMMRLMPKVWRNMQAVAPSLVYDARVMDRFELPTEELSRISVPTLALAGSKGKPEMKAAQEGIARAVPDSEHGILEGQTHQVSPKALAPVLDDFFRRRGGRE
jgi:pimeloyl-ACP methyl ester carboxylesterase